MSLEAAASTLTVDITDTSSLLNDPTTPDMQEKTMQTKDMGAQPRPAAPQATAHQPTATVAAAGHTAIPTTTPATPPAVVPGTGGVKRKEPHPASPSAAESMTFADLKAAQRRSMKAVRDIALTEINALAPDMSEASRHETAAVLQAHVNEMSSSAFTHLARVYFPTELQSTKKPDNPVNPAALARIKELDAQIHAAEHRILAHQTRLPATVREILHASFADKAKAFEDALASPSSAAIDTDTAITYSEEDIAAVKATFARISSKIDHLSIKLPLTMQAAADTVQVVQHAVNQPKSRFDALMEHGNVAVTSEKPSTPSPKSLRAKLAESL